MISFYNDISSFIWNVCDDVLRGLFKPHEYGELILPFTVLRRLDCVIEDRKDEIVSLYDEYKTKVENPSSVIMERIKTSVLNHSRFDLKRLRRNPQNVYINFQNYIGGFSENVIEIIEHFQLKPLVEKLNKNNRLLQVLDKFSEINLHPNKVPNYMMGQIFEELLRRFSEMSNETSGEHYTPRDIVRLLVSLVFSESSHTRMSSGILRSIFDPCCGSGGMLTIGKDWIQENVSDNIKIDLFGQELNPQSYSVCKSDMMISGENPDNIRLGNSLSEDCFSRKRFDYMIANPPYGVSWKSDKDFVQNESQTLNGRFSVGTPRTSDGQLLFLQHMISKMQERGSRIGIVFNGSPLFNGDSGSGESEIRKWIIENDWLECIVSLPDQLFFNTSITTYLWILTNKKTERRQGKVQLIDGSAFFDRMKKSLGKKRKELSPRQRDKLVNLYLDFKEGDRCQIYPNKFFGYTKVQVEQPLIKNGTVLTNRNGQLRPDKSKRNYERIPLQDDVDKYFAREVKPHLPDSWIDRSKDRVGYEITFTKYFYKFKAIRSLKEITQDLMKLDEEMEGLMKETLQG